MVRHTTNYLHLIIFSNLHIPRNKTLNDLLPSNHLFELYSTILLAKVIQLLAVNNELCDCDHIGVRSEMLREITCLGLYTVGLRLNSGLHFHFNPGKHACLCLQYYRLGDKLPPFCPFSVQGLKICLFFLINTFLYGVLGR